MITPQEQEFLLRERIKRLQKSAVYLAANDFEKANMAYDVLLNFQAEFPPQISQSNINFQDQDFKQQVEVL